ncbi:hypothetical protein PMM47T1_09751 [Pseudomonas sp. M47T1]|uniref:GAD-like domain-containing protein n=1 Tax=Pseudomonas sp. M47T1 TaxID=1179778 RepID=UPI0002606785|nr:GAD-like domain-containing protein [Pseudomonas sp. M47T1]EIK96934.1 hypothetical protein PMM47T1_09751 [Pseudomonas sp. M47T1]
MDEAFKMFLGNFSIGTVGRCEVPASSIRRYEGRLPSKLINYWEEHGWAGYGDGVFWTVDPERYEGVVSSWLEETPLDAKDKFHVIARSAFGLLYLWGENTGPSLKIAAYASRYIERESLFVPNQLDKAVESFFMLKGVRDNDFCDMFTSAKKKLGVLESDEMYGFFPALTLGGRGEIEDIQKVKAVEHLVFLSQISDLQSYGF